ncbi:lipoprotein [Planococcus sp. ISL-109]|uniref:lipoprotein n=1 Tax=Planococcus sp. ISL-109 TaxID=2819166 RepID=UPI001BEBF34C|nr:lipoprotein [Planococcus sp. ISL-109]MBT2583315.1 lipoprotein [Planococcus sp. ISL-109]
MKKSTLALTLTLFLAGCSGEDHKLHEYEEYDRIAEHIDVSEYETEVETDNDGSRVLFFADEAGAKVYKSVYVKDTQRLELIHLDEQGALFNGTLE